ncbi:phosphoethanolamine transferase [Campylobacter gastrosuis]|uniref:Phosphoethanolamine transferase n=1 Tax=Campylobacter gastrosuis TaxID=2974576 RepID=A0ABT7HQS2_9BACT|nr:phosphoethanolamine transferase [Campylobacter gastrosuis]MDL0088968.1 phosphoethanolamine transferase [Campylobacter gastrosuis]
MSEFLSQNRSVNLAKINQKFDEIALKNSQIVAKNGVKNVVFVIGESLGRDFMGLYNPKFKTTPHQNELLSSGNLINFTDTIAPELYTQAVLKTLLNFSNENKSWQDSLNIVDLFKLSGYKTFWLSNQDYVPIDRANATATHTANRADKSLFLKYGELWDTKNSFDDELLAPLKNFYQNAKTRGFYALHLIANHVDYKNRYTDDFAKFSPKDISTNALNFTQKEQVAHYLNSVLYNDFIISEIFKIFKDDEAIIIYISDHAQVLYRQKDVLSHAVLNRFVLEIPLIFIATDKFRANHADIWRELNEAKNLAFMSDDLIHVAADIIGVKPLEYDAKRSVISGEFNARERIINGVNYESPKNEKPFW